MLDTVTTVSIVLVALNCVIVGVFLRDWAFRSSTLKKVDELNASMNNNIQEYVKGFNGTNENVKRLQDKVNAHEMRLNANFQTAAK